MSNTKNSLVIAVPNIVYNPKGVSVCQKGHDDLYFTKGSDCIDHYLRSHMKEDLNRFTRSDLDLACCRKVIDQGSYSAYSFINHYLRCSGIGSKVQLDMVSDCAAIIKLVPKDAKDSKTLVPATYSEKLKINQQEQQKIETKYNEVLAKYSKSISGSINQPFHHNNQNKPQSSAQKEGEDQKKNSPHQNANQQQPETSQTPMQKNPERQAMIQKRDLV